MKVYSSTLAPGRELDALVAEKVMGWTTLTHTDEGFYYGFPPSVDSKVYSKETALPNYSTDIAAAWEVVEKMGGAFNLEHLRGWAAAFTDEHQWPNGPHSSEALSAPHAICLAALKAVTGV